MAITNYDVISDSTRMKQLENSKKQDLSPVTADTTVWLDNETSLHDFLGKLISNGKVSADYLPSSVDDVVEGYYDGSAGKFYSDAGKTAAITGEAGKIYVDLGDSDGKIYRYDSGGSKYALVSGVPAATQQSIAELRGQVASVGITGDGAHLVGEAVSDTITASSNVAADSINITQQVVNGKAETKNVAYNGKSVSYDFSLAAADNTKTEVYTFVGTGAYGATSKTATSHVYIVKPIYVGAGKAGKEIMVDDNKQTARTTPSGTYIVEASEGDYVYLAVPSEYPWAMRVKSIKMSGFDFPYEELANSDEDGLSDYGGYVFYRSLNTYKEGWLTIDVTGTGNRMSVNPNA